MLQSLQRAEDIMDNESRLQYIGALSRPHSNKGIKMCKGGTQKNTGLFGNFPNMGGGRGLPNSQNFCKLTKYFFVCQIHSEVLKYVLQRGGGDI